MTINIYEAKAHFSELVQRASEGEEIVIARHGKPAARLVPLASTSPRQWGGWEGQIWTSEDFDQADAELAALMMGS
jgi:prevent-host-death family protein